MSVATHAQVLIQEQHLELLPQKAVFWKKENCLIVSDVHFGKVGHFRKAGIAIPKAMEQEDLAVLSDLIQEYKPGTLIFLGDLFHSEMNNDWHWFILWRQLFSGIRMILVEGNHDILNPEIYKEAGFEVFDQYTCGPFLFIHDNSKQNSGSAYIISGHIHPGVRLKGKGRQAVSLPCFYFGSKEAVLPAFGKFTGNYCLRIKEGDAIFGISGSNVVKL
ncbi:ligase-associated DNA damage response endonuclease PdeM [Rubrolithibacter danxiaensis]|uniref:ligase-associated DNA damage response endonuclease PdeM n=1 Tax=Rubrolithibacter danxiaensis TaxID=3390805 RepID=UPI003BF77417